MAYSISKILLVPIFKIWIGGVKGLENLPIGRPFILAPNHSSYMEHMLISSIIVPKLDKKLYFIAKKEHFEGISQKSWHKIWSRYVGYIPIDRNKGEKALK